MTPTIIRASSLSFYPDCPRRQAARIFRDEIIAAGHALNEDVRSIGAAVGTAVHKAASVMLEEKAKSGELAPESVALDAAVETVRVGIGDGVIYDRETPEINTAEQQVVRMSKAYRRGIAPQIHPIRVEERLEAQVTPSLVLSGQSDVIAREPGRVRDLKTGKMLGNHNPQLGAYSLLARTVGLDIHEAGIDFVQRVGLKRPQPEAESYRHEIEKVETAAVNVLRTVEADLRTFREGDAPHGLMPGDPWAFPANPSSKLCSAKWCSAWGTSFCHEHAIKEEE